MECEAIHSRGCRYRRKPQGPDHLGTRSADREAEVELDLGEPIEIPSRSYAWPLLKNVPVYPTLPRPRLGSRHYVRKHTRRYIKALFNDVVDFRDCTALNAGKLLMVTIAYAEEAIMEWIKDVDDAMVRFYSGKAAMGRSPELIEVRKARLRNVTHSWFIWFTHFARLRSRRVLLEAYLGSLFKLHGFVFFESWSCVNTWTFRNLKSNFWNL